MDGYAIGEQLVKISNRIEAGSAYSRFLNLLDEVLPSIDLILDQLRDWESEAQIDCESSDFRDDVLRLDQILRRPMLKKFLNHPYLKPNPDDVVFLRRVAANISGHPVDRSNPIAPKSIERLTEKQQQIADIILRSSDPLTGKGIVNTFKEQYGEEISESTLTRHIIPVLKELRGLKNKRGVGYFFLGE